MACSILCQACGVEAPTRYVEFHQNIGALVMRFRRSVKGNLCKRCIHGEFWKKTGTTASVGWFGTISLIVTPIFIINNIVYYIKSAAMPKTPADAQVPQLTPETIAAINPLAGELFSRLNQQEPIDRVAMDIASRVGVTPGASGALSTHDGAVSSAIAAARAGISRRAGSSSTCAIP